MTLGNKLKNTLEEIEAAREQEYQRRLAEDQLRFAKEREEKKKLIERLAQLIRFKIEAGKVPEIQISDSNERDWLLQFSWSQSKDQDLWKDFIQWAKSELLDISIKKKEFNKYDFDQNITLVVTPN